MNMPMPMTTQGTAIQATPIVKLRDLVRQNKYYVRIRFDHDKLEKCGLQAHQAAAALRPAPLSILPDPFDKANDPLSWIATYSGMHSPHVDELANSTVEIVRTNRPIRLADIVVAGTGIARLQTQDEEAVQLGSQQ